MATEIEQIFEAYNAATLNSLATVAGLLVGKKKPNKQQLVTLMQEEYFTAERVMRSYAKLSSREKQVINRVLLRGGETSSKTLKRELLRAKLVTEAPEQPKAKGVYYTSQPAGYVGTPSNALSTVFEDVMARLTYHGLLFSKPGDVEGGYSYKFQFSPEENLIIPTLVRLHLPAPQPLPPEDHVWQPTRVQQEEAARFLRELYLYWDFVRRTEVALLQNGLVGKRHLKLINQVLLAPDPLLENASSEDDTSKLHTIRHMLEALGLVQSAQGRLTIANKGKELLPTFWGKSEDQQIADCVQVWMTVENAGETDKTVKHFQPDYANARRHLLTALQKLPSGQWQEAFELLNGLQEFRQNFLFPERSKVEAQKGRSHYYYAYGYYSGSPTEILKKMDEAEQNFVQNSCAGFLFQCGLVQLGYASEQAKTWEAMQLTALGGAVLARVNPATAKQGVRLAESAEPYQADSDQGRIIVQPNFQLLAIGPVRLRNLAQIDLFAERRKADIGVFEYHLSRESVYSAQRAGMNVAAIRAFLQKTTGTPLPQNVARTLDEWGAHHERIVFRTGVHLLQAADEAVLQALMDSNTVADHLARVLAPGVALVKKEQQDKLLKGLLQSDLLPAVSGDQPASADHSVIMNKQGLIQPIHAVPSLHLSGRLARFAEPQPDGRWQITPASARRMGGNRKKVLELLEEMARLQRGPLPAALADQIKTWGAYFGEASSEVLTLLEFRDQQALTELAKRPNLQGLLTPFRAGDRAVAVVPSERLDEIKAILADLGVILKAGLAR